MNFNSFQFIVFFVAVYALYLFLPHRPQNRLLLVASCLFYASWDWRFLFLMFVSTSVDYFCGLKILVAKTREAKRFFLLLSLCVNLSILGFFKYFNFFASNFERLFGLFGLGADPVTLNIILPLGISFYTFEAMSYVIDVYRGSFRPVRRYSDYALFITYFPHLVAGPIMRAKDLLPQIIQKRTVTYEKFREGCFFLLWGYFQKIFVADNLAPIVDATFSMNQPTSGVQVLLAMYAFAFQIYCDFAGYSNIAKGLGKLMGFDITTNFNLPYFSANPRQLWQRWHISLSNWFYNYLYIPLSGGQKGLRGNKKNVLAPYRNIIITMLLVGLWHGAAWTYVFWGLYHGLLIILYRIMLPYLKPWFSNANPFFQNVWLSCKILFFFHLWCFGTMIFRAQSLQQVFSMTNSLFFNLKFEDIFTLGATVRAVFFYTGFLVLIECFQFKYNDQKIVLNAPPALRYAFYYGCLLLIMFYGALGQNQFIYFQF